MKLTLDIDEIENAVIGISCHFKNYRLVWEINRKLKFQLERAEDHVITSHLGEGAFVDFAFPVYEYFDEIHHLKYRILNNHTTFMYFDIELHDTLVPEYKELDYILLIDGYMDDSEKQQLLKALKEIKIILAVIEIDVSRIKRKQDLIF